MIDIGLIDEIQNMGHYFEILAWRFDHLSTFDTIVYVLAAVGFLTVFNWVIKKVV